MSATIERRFHLANQGNRRGGFHRVLRRGDEPIEVAPLAVPVPRAEQVHPLARRMAMAIRCEQLIASGVACDQASLAAAAGMTRAWVTVVMRLTLLAPDIQEKLLHLEPDAEIDHRVVQQVSRLPSWQRQREAWGHTARFC